jgi:hypothetical protein
MTGALAAISATSDRTPALSISDSRLPFHGGKTYMRTIREVSAAVLARVRLAACLRYCPDNFLDAVADRRFCLFFAASQSFALGPGIAPARHLPIEPCGHLARFRQWQARVMGKDEFAGPAAGAIAQAPGHDAGGMDRETQAGCRADGDLERLRAGLGGGRQLSFCELHFLRNPVASALKTETGFSVSPMLPQAKFPSLC